MVKKVEEKPKAQQGKPQNRGVQQKTQKEEPQSKEEKIQPDKIEERIKRFNSFSNMKYH